MNTPLLAAFPRRPLQVQRSWKQALSLFGALAIGFCALVIAPVWFAANFAPGIAHDTRVWSSGVVAHDAKVGGACRTKLSLLPFTTCMFDITYEAEPGVRRQATSEALLFGGLNFDTQAVVKFEPQEPHGVAVSWTSDLITARWLTLGGLCLLFVLLGLSIVWAGLVSVREYRLYRALARNPQPILVRITDKRFRSGANFTMEYAFEGDVGEGSPAGQRVSGRQHMKLLGGTRDVPPHKWPYEEPLFTRPDKTEALALVDAQGRVLLVKHSLHPLCLSEAEQNDLWAALATGNAKGAA